MVAVALAVVLAALVAGLTQRNHLVNQLDAQLIQLSENAARLSAQLQRAEGSPLAEGGLVATTSYIGVVSPSGSLRTIATPTEDPDLVPDFDGSEMLSMPTTIGTVAGEAAEVRAITFDTATGQRVLIAMPTTRLEDTLQTLVVTQVVAGSATLLVLALFVWWMIHQGLRPIRKMTAAADAITAGGSDRRVDEIPGQTEAARLARALNLMIDTTQAAQVQRRRFVADASHELRTPLTTLQGYANLYAQGALNTPDALDDAMRRISGEAGRMKRIVEQLLVLADLDEGTPVRRTVIDLSIMLGEVASDVRALQPDRATNVEAPNSLIIEADHDKIFQAITALASNALQYTPPDTPLTFRANAEGSAARISVEDRGPGVSPEDKPHLFDRFYRADRSRSRATGGNGLGLAIVAGIAEAHAGSYGVEDTAGGGTTFWIRLPLDVFMHR